jgi:hypothetical protein
VSSLAILPEFENVTEVRAKISREMVLPTPSRPEILFFRIGGVAWRMAEQEKAVVDPVVGEVYAVTPDERTRLKEHAERWKRLGPLLEAQREEDVRRSDVFGSYSFFAGMVLKNIELFPPGPHSGLVEQQAWFRKLHPKSR